MLTTDTENPSSKSKFLRTLSTVAMLGVGLTLPAHTASGQVSADDNVIVQSSMLHLPGHQKPLEIFYEVVNGQAILEGDIDLGPVSELQSRYGSEEIARANRAENGLWPDGKVYYDPNMPEEIRSVAMSAMQDISAASLGGVEFKVRDNLNSYIKFGLTDEPGVGGTSPIGKQFIRNNIKLSSTAGNSTAMHEILHTLGFYHEQSRNDRDQYVYILLNNVVDGKKHNFKKHLSSRAESSYDYASIMHYSRKAFGKTDPDTGDRLETIVAKIAGETIGQRAGLSNLDIEGLRSAYPVEGSLPEGSLPNTCADAPTLFQDIGFQGQQFSAIENQVNLHDSNYGDSASSLCIPAGWSISVHENVEYGGSRLILTGPESFDNLGSNWNDKISSILIVNAPAGSQPTIQCPAVTLFEHVNFRGNKISYPDVTNKTSLGGWNDKFSSACIPAGVSVDLYQNSNYGGQKYKVRGPKNITHLGKISGNWNDKASSLRVYTGLAPSQLVSCSIPTFYEHVNFGGNRTSHAANTNKTSLGGWNDKYSSACIPAGVSVDLYQHSNYGGQKHKITGPKKIGHMAELFGDWNDKASSLRVYTGSAPSQLVSCSAPTFYEHVNFGGNKTSYAANTNKTSLGGWNDKFSSACIPAGVSVDLYQNSNYGGQKYKVRGPKNITHLGKISGNWNDKASSLRVYTGSAPSRLVRCSVPTFYEHVDFGGNKISHAANTNKTSLGGWNDKFSSACIPAGVSVDLYQNSNYGGQKYKVRGPKNITHLGKISGNWNDKASSLRVYTGSAPSRLVRCSVPTFYEHANFKGRKITYQGNTVQPGLGGWNDKFSSACIPAGMSVDLYEHSKYRGKKYSIRGPRELQNLGSVSGNWNDKASSLMVGG